ncbi:GTP cyclohydrolase II [Microlunatus sp. GCM10028923]|uniref:GTP cyclohydrolase II n=1 Tax=Microlunatus sp. GCM10028923 TaxID=3273400 RepID=UPI003612F823
MINSVEEALAGLRDGLPVLVADNPDRENEVDVIVAADRVTPHWLNWTIRHSSGFVCAPMPSARADALRLPLMVPHSEDPRRTAYTVTVDAATGISTGISAADRTRTLRVLADPESVPQSLIRPGHVLPLRSVPGGVLARAGHTEAATDLVRLAGTGTVAGIAELANEDGEMSRLADGELLAQRFDLPLITISDLIACRREHDHQIPDLEAVLGTSERATLPTEFGDFAVQAYRDPATGDDHLVLTSATPATGTPLVRVHSECLTGDAFGSLRCDCGPQLRASLRATAAEGGLIVYLRGHEGRGIGLLDKINAYRLQDDGRDTVDANLELGLPADARDFGAAGRILRTLGVAEVRLLTNNPDKITALVASGVAVTEAVPLQVGLDPHNRDYLITKRDRLGHRFGSTLEDDKIMIKEGSTLTESGSHR